MAPGKAREHANGLNELMTGVMQMQAYIVLRLLLLLWLIGASAADTLRVLNRVARWAKATARGGRAAL